MELLEEHQEEGYISLSGLIDSIHAELVLAAAQGNLGAARYKVASESVGALQTKAIDLPVKSRSPGGTQPPFVASRVELELNVAVQKTGGFLVKILGVGAKAGVSKKDTHTVRIVFERA